MIKYWTKTSTCYYSFYTQFSKMQPNLYWQQISVCLVMGNGEEMSYRDPRNILKWWIRSFSWLCWWFYSLYAPQTHSILQFKNMLFIWGQVYSIKKETIFHENKSFSWYILPWSPKLTLYPTGCSTRGHPGSPPPFYCADLRSQVTELWPVTSMKCGRRKGDYFRDGSKKKKNPSE